VPWWWWPPALLIAVLMAAELHMGYPGVRSWLPYVLLLPLAAAVLIWLGRVRVGVGTPSGGAERAVRELHAGVAHLPVSMVGRVDVVTGEAKREALGPQLDPQAFVLHRPWVGPAVRIEVLDPPLLDQSGEESLREILGVVGRMSRPPHKCVKWIPVTFAQRGERITI